MRGSEDMLKMVGDIFEAKLTFQKGISIPTNEENEDLTTVTTCDNQGQWIISFSPITAQTPNKPGIEMFEWRLQLCHL